jgi:hypothetical protein
MLAPSDVLISLCILIVAAFRMPTHGHCPNGKGWTGNGVRPDGVYACLHNADVESDAPADAVFVGRIYCPSAALPMVTDERSVECIRRKGR